METDSKKTGTEETVITIKLSESRNAKVFREDELIHVDEYRRVKKWIDERIEKVNDINVKEKERLHDTITVLGSRGSGKTSFLYSLLRYYEDRSNVEVIKVIDPTLIEEKGHIFLTIISQIAKSVNDKLSKIDCNPEDPSYHKKKDWEKKLKNLAAGLPSIDGVGHGYEDWQDPEFIMDKGLRSVHAAKNLEADFHHLLEFALKILEKKIFIIALDDIDIDFRKGWPVLEAVRKYLTSPYIVTLLSGDLKLFSKAIRKQQWKNFGKALMINEGEKLHRISDYDDLVTEMEGQYLQKVLQPQRRIHLLTIQEKINIRGKEKINIYIDDKSNPENRIDKYCDTIFGKFGIKNQYQAEAYRSFLFSLPIRTQIQFLSGLKDISAVNLKGINVIDAFVSDLYEKRVDTDIAKANCKYLDSVILKLLIDEKVLDEAYQLQPTTTDTSLNSSLMSLSFLFSKSTIGDPYLIFDYMVKIGYLRNLLSNLGYQEQTEKKVISLKSPSIEGLCYHSAIYGDRVLRDILCYITAYLQATQDKDRKSNSSLGMIKLPGLEVGRNEKKEEIAWRIDTVFKDVSEQIRNLAFFPLSISRNRKGEGYPVYSVYVLLATIGELIRKVQEGDVSKGILELSQIRSYPMPIFNGVSSMEASDIVMPNVERSEKDNFLENKITGWVKRYPKGMCISPHLLGKISTRFFYSLGNIEGKEGSIDLGQRMHIRMVILMNSILVEDAKENLNDAGGLNINNPNYSSKIFIDNLKAVSEAINKLNTDDNNTIDLPFSKWMLSCPLFLAYLNMEDVDQNSKLIDVLKPFIASEKNPMDDMLKYSVFDQLSKVKYKNPNGNKSTISKSTPEKLKSFYYGGETIQRTIDHLKNNKYLISYNDFMTGDVNELIVRLKKIFARNVEEYGIEKVKKYITDNDIRPW